MIDLLATSIIILLTLSVVIVFCEEIAEVLENNWQAGRQYATKNIQKLLLLEFNKWKIDVYLLRAKAGTVVGEHIDTVEGHEHYRWNITLKGLHSVCISDKKKDQKFGNWYCFRPDIQKHSAQFFTDSLVLSIGKAYKIDRESCKSE